MILGYDTLMGAVVDTPQTPVQNITYVSVSDCIVDEIHVRNTVTDISEKTGYDNSTVFDATFSGDLEAGNIGMRGNKIVKLRLKRRQVGHTNFYTVAEFDFENAITADGTTTEKHYTYHDYGALGNVEYEYYVVPVDESGIEGDGSIITTILNFDGWWLIDLDNPEEYNLQFVFNMDSVSINTEQDRTVLNSFSRFPYVRYGAKHVKHGTLSSLFTDSDTQYATKVVLLKQLQKLDEMTQMHKSFLLKDGNGRRYIVDIHTPSEQTYEGIKQIADVSVEWYQIGVIED